MTQGLLNLWYSPVFYISVTGHLNVPLHNVVLSSVLVSGEVVLGVCPEFPIDGVSLIFGNDLAGPWVLSMWLVSSSPRGSHYVRSPVQWLIKMCLIKAKLKMNIVHCDLRDMFFVHLESQPDFVLNDTAKTADSLGTTASFWRISLESMMVLLVMIKPTLFGIPFPPLNL